MIIDELLELGICLFLPISLYFNYLTYIKILEVKETSMIFEFALISSVLLMLKYNNLEIIYTSVILLIPVIISLTKKKLIVAAFLLLIITQELSNTIYDVSITKLIQTIIMFIIYLFLINHFLKIGTNIIDLSNVEKELEKEKELRSSISKLTHELKNPIAVCNGYLEMLNLKDIEKAKHYINIIREEVNRSKTIIDEFSSFGKLKTINKEELDLTMLLEETVNILKPLYKEHDASIIFKTKKEVYINGDYNKLKQVLINILKNTIEARDENKKLIATIKLIENKKSVCLSIEDTGMGMTKETLSKVSNIFFTTKQNGTGLGLAFSKEVINLHKGTIKIKSKLNIGTTISITLPK